MDYFYFHVRSGGQLARDELGRQFDGYARRGEKRRALFGTLRQPPDGDPNATLGPKLAAPSSAGRASAPRQASREHRSNRAVAA